MNDSFIFYTSFVDAIDTLPEEDQLRAYKAISHYATKGEVPSPSIGIAYTIFLMAKPQIDANKNRRENGGKGGRPKKETYGFEDENHRLSDEKPNVNVNVNVNDNVNKKENVEKKKNFTPPTQEEVEAYCRERSSSVDPKAFYDYFTQGNWTDSKGQKVRNWKQKLITWENHRNDRASPKKSGFNDMMHQDYDMDAIEKAILNEA
jgi:hypothetical protein